MSYYIKGDEERSAEVIALLESKGGINSHMWVGEGSETYYYMDKDNKIQMAETPIEKRIVESICTELTLPLPINKYKIGDIVRYKVHTPVSVSSCAGKILSFNYSYNGYKIENSPVALVPYECVTSIWEPRRGENVLIRNSLRYEWDEGIFSYLGNDECKYIMQGGARCKFCIPFDENKLGKITDD